MKKKASKTFLWKRAKSQKKAFTPKEIALEKSLGEYLNNFSKKNH